MRSVRPAWTATRCCWPSRAASSNAPSSAVSRLAGRCCAAANPPGRPSCPVSAPSSSRPRPTRSPLTAEPPGRRVAVAGRTRGGHHGPVSQLDLLAAIRRDFAIPSGPIAALDIGPVTGTAPRHPALLVPGFTGSKEDFAPILLALAAAGHRAVSIDQRGQYESRGPDDPSAYSLDALATDL